MIRDLLLAPNQLTLLRLVFVPFIIINVLDENWVWALALFVLAGLSDGLDGLVARRLHQQSALGQYLDPIADKLLLSSLFLVLSVAKQIPWRYTVLVFSRDVCILLTAAVMFAVSSYRQFRPSLFGKINTTAQIGAVFFVLLSRAVPQIYWLMWLRHTFLWMTFAFTLLSGLHYTFVTAQRMREQQARGAGAR
jgi:cardiolipin synthase (CMP-forming)